MITNWKNIILKETSTIKEAMQNLSGSALRIVLIADEDTRLIATVSDGDIRRGLLRGCSIEDTVSNVMNKNPIVVTLEMKFKDIQTLLYDNSIFAAPRVDQHKVILGLEVISGLNRNQCFHVPVLIMAGGFGKRLGDLTKELPKPMLSLGKKPILEHIIDGLSHQGLKNVFISTHYKSQIIKDYFKNGQEKGLEIQYIEEDVPLGTAGCLFFLNQKVDGTFIVMNGDVLIEFDFHHLIDFHESHDALITMCVKQKFYDVPYGVVEIDGIKAKNIIEKPQYMHSVNAGIYCFSNKIFQYTKDKEHMDMPALIKLAIQDGQKVLAFPLHENWVDIGSFETLDMARKEHC